MNLDRFFQKKGEAFYIDTKGNKKFKGVLCRSDTIRKDKAIDQTKLPPTPICEVFSYINEFIEMLRKENGYTHENVRFDTIVLDNSIHPIIDNGIICNQLDWKLPIYDTAKRRYVEWDYKYDVISSVFHTKDPKNLIWLKFTQTGRVGVVAKSFDINFNRKRDDGSLISSDFLVKKVGDSWDKSFVMIFPMTPEILGNRSVGELELGIGNYLTDEKNVPIIDFYSHNN